MFTVNGKELDYDIFDADKAEAYEKEMAAVTQKMAELMGKGEHTFAEGVRAQCEIVAECFDNLFGAGTAVKIFDGKVNLVLALKSFEELAEGINGQKSEIVKMAKAVSAKYSGNRAQRRTK